MRDATRFPATLTDEALRQVVVEVTRAVDAKAPELVSPAAYDRQLAADAGGPEPRWAGAPRAEATRRRLGRLPWYELLLVLHGPTRSVEHRLALNSRNKRQTFTQQQAVDALQFLATRACAQSFTPSAYERAREEAIAEDRRAWRHATNLEGRLPDADQVRVAFGEHGPDAWDAALAAAGLQPRQRELAAPGMDWTDAMLLHLADVGCLPAGSRPLRAYAEARAIRLARRRLPIDQHRAEAVARGHVGRSGVAGRRGRK